MGNDQHQQNTGVIVFTLGPVYNELGYNEHIFLHQKY